MHAKGPELATLFARIVGIVDGFPSRLGAGIRFADYVFAEPVPLDSFLVPPQMMAIYAVLVPDPTWGPRQFQPIFFGIINGQRQGQLSPEEYRSCLRVAGGKGLYVATCNLPPLFQPSESHRIQRELIHVYSPLCNRDSADAPSTDLERKVDALAKQNQEHELLIKVVLAAIGHLGQPTQEPKKRPVGFQPSSATTRNAPASEGRAP